MNKEVITNAVGSLDKILIGARDAIYDAGDQYFNGEGEDRPSYAEPEEVLTRHLNRLYQVLLIVLEAGELPDLKADLIQNWKLFGERELGIGKIDYDDEYERTYSAAYSYIRTLVDGLKMTITHEITSEEAWKIAQLEGMLEDTAVLVRRRNVIPVNETDIQKVMHDYLKACFSHFVPDPKVSGIIKDFKPDCGISDIHAAIEFKLVHTEEKSKVAFSGIAEDTAGYGGSKDWTRFYAVIYQAGPFIQKRHLWGDLKRIGAYTWKPIVVTGPTNPAGTKADSITGSSVV